MEEQKKDDFAKLAEFTGFSEQEIAVIKNTVAKGLNNTELAYFLSLVKSIGGLSPFKKEIWAYKDQKGNVMVFAGRDGFLSKAQADPRWNGMISSEVCEKDVFEVSVTTGEITHKPNYIQPRGKIAGAYAIIKPKGCDYATFEWAEFSVYNKGYNVWKADPAAMIKKCAEAHALKKAFGINGLNVEYDFDTKDGVAIPISESTQKNVIDEIKSKIINALDEYQGEDKQEIQKLCASKNKSGEFTEEFAHSILRRLSLEK